MLNNVLDLLRADGSIVVNKKLARVIGLEEAVIYSELVSQYLFWQNKGELKDDKGNSSPDGKWFFCTIEKLEEHTTIKRKKQQVAISNLTKNGLIDVKKMGLPAKRYFTITEGIINYILGGTNKFVQNGQTDSIKGSDDNKTEEAPFNQYVPNGQTVMSQTDKLDRSFRPTINNIFINNEFNNLEEEESAQLSALISAYKDSIDPKMTKSIEKALYEWKNKLSFEVLMDEIEFAAKNNAKSFTFLEKMLQQDLNSNVSNITDLYAKRESFKQKKSTKPKKASARTENLPEWFVNQRDGITQEDSITEEELLEIDQVRQKLLKELRQTK